MPNNVTKSIIGTNHAARLGRGSRNGTETMSKKKKLVLDEDDEEEYGPFTPQDYIDTLGFDPWAEDDKNEADTRAARYRKSYKKKLWEVLNYVARRMGNKGVQVKRTFVAPQTFLKHWGRIDFDFPDEEPGKKAAKNKAKESGSNKFFTAAKRLGRGSEYRKSGKKRKQI